MQIEQRNVFCSIWHSRPQETEDGTWFDFQVKFSLGLLEMSMFEELMTDHVKQVTERHLRDWVIDLDSFRQHPDSVFVWQPYQLGTRMLRVTDRYNLEDLKGELRSYQDPMFEVRTDSAGWVNYLRRTL